MLHGPRHVRRVPAARRNVGEAGGIRLRLPRAGHTGQDLHELSAGDRALGGEQAAAHAADDLPPGQEVDVLRGPAVPVHVGEGDARRAPAGFFKDGLNGMRCLYVLEGILAYRTHALAVHQHVGDRVAVVRGDAEGLVGAPLDFGRLRGDLAAHALFDRDGVGGDRAAAAPAAAAGIRGRGSGGGTGVAGPKPIDGPDREGVALAVGQPGSGIAGRAAAQGDHGAVGQGEQVIGDRGARVVAGPLQGHKAAARGGSHHGGVGPVGRYMDGIAPQFAGVTALAHQLGPQGMAPVGLGHHILVRGGGGGQLLPVPGPDQIIVFRIMMLRPVRVPGLRHQRASHGRSRRGHGLLPNIQPVAGTPDVYFAHRDGGAGQHARVVAAGGDRDGDPGPGVRAGQGIGRLIRPLDGRAVAIPLVGRSIAHLGLKNSCRHRVPDRTGTRDRHNAAGRGGGDGERIRLGAAGVVALALHGNGAAIFGLRIGAVAQRVVRVLHQRFPAVLHVDSRLDGGAGVGVAAGIAVYAHPGNALGRDGKGFGKAAGVVAVFSGGDGHGGRARPVALGGVHVVGHRGGVVALLEQRAVRHRVAGRNGRAGVDVRSGNGQHTLRQRLFADGKCGGRGNARVGITDQRGSDGIGPRVDGLLRAGAVVGASGALIAIGIGTACIRTVRAGGLAGAGIAQGCAIGNIAGRGRSHGDLELVGDGQRRLHRAGVDGRPCGERHGWGHIHRLVRRADVVALQRLQRGRPAGDGIGTVGDAVVIVHGHRFAHAQQRADARGPGYLALRLGQGRDRPDNAAGHGCDGNVKRYRTPAVGEIGGIRGGQRALIAIRAALGVIRAALQRPGHVQRGPGCAFAIRSRQDGVLRLHRRKQGVRVHLRAGKDLAQRKGLPRPRQHGLGDGQGAFVHRNGVVVRRCGTGDLHRRTGGRGGGSFTVAGDPQHVRCIGSDQFPAVDGKGQFRIVRPVFPALIVHFYGNGALADGDRKIPGDRYAHIVSRGLGGSKLNRHGHRAAPIGLDGVRIHHGKVAVDRNARRVGGTRGGKGHGSGILLAVSDWLCYNAPPINAEIGNCDGNRSALAVDHCGKFGGSPLRSVCGHSQRSIGKGDLVIRIPGEFRCAPNRRAAHFHAVLVVQPGGVCIRLHCAAGDRLDHRVRRAQLRAAAEQLGLGGRRCVPLDGDRSLTLRVAADSGNGEALPGRVGHGGLRRARDRDNAARNGNALDRLIVFIGDRPVHRAGKALAVLILHRGGERRGSAGRAAVRGDQHVHLTAGNVQLSGLGRGAGDRQVGGPAHAPLLRRDRIRARLGRRLDGDGIAAHGHIGGILAGNRPGDLADFSANLVIGLGGDRLFGARTAGHRDFIPGQLYRSQHRLRPGDGDCDRIARDRAAGGRKLDSRTQRVLAHGDGAVVVVRNPLGGRRRIIGPAQRRGGHGAALGIQRSHTGRGAGLIDRRDGNVRYSPKFQSTKLLNVTSIIGKACRQVAASICGPVVHIIASTLCAQEDGTLLTAVCKKLVEQ